MRVGKTEAVGNLRDRLISLGKNSLGAFHLLLKDIFPQNAVDIGMMTKTGPKSVIYKMFRKKEERL